MVELFFNRIILRIQRMTPDCTRQRVPMFFFQRRVTRKTTSSRATEICAFIAKKTKTNPRASKSELCLKGGLYLTVYNSELCSEIKRQIELSFSCWFCWWHYKLEHWLLPKRNVCACALQWTRVLQCVDYVL